MNPRCYLLLDFDGVLHPKWGGPDTYFADLAVFDAVLREFPLVQVVIASSWRHTQSLDTLRERFSTDLRARIIGVTPDVPPGPGASEHGSRHAEALAWLARYGEPGVPWVAIDDVPHLYAPGAPVVVAMDGFGPAEAEALRAALADPASFAKQCQARDATAFEPARMQ